MKNIIVAVFLLCSVTLSGAVPKLIVVISYDQMRGDYPEKWEGLWGKKGFNRIRNEGVHYTQCYFDHATNMTCPGHSVLMTGCYPAKTGIVSNDFYDKDRGKMCYCTADSLYPVRGNFREGRSPLLMKMPTLGDYLMEQSPKSKVMGIGLKDRAGIVMSGKKAQTVLWFDEEIGEFGTSSYYTRPAWLSEWNAQNSLKKYAGKAWNTLISPAIGEVDSVRWEGNFPGGGKTFPHLIPADTADKSYTDAFLVSPYSVEYLFAAAREMIYREKLGKDNAPDILSIAVSTTDYVGHVFGPDSRELQELYLHIDRYLGEFIDYLDTKVGRDKYVLVITSDHGVGPIPEAVREVGREKIDAGRLSKDKVKAKMNKYLQMFLPAGSQDDCIDRIELPSVFLNHQVLEKYHLNEDALLDSLVQFTRQLEGMNLAASTKKLLKARPADWDEAIWKMVKNDVYAARTGEMICYAKPYWIYGSNPATHGTPYDYDRHVPLMMLGNVIKKRTSSATVSPADIAPTIGTMLGIRMLGIDGHAIDLR